MTAKILTDAEIGPLVDEMMSAHFVQARAGARKVLQEAARLGMLRAAEIAKQHAAECQEEASAEYAKRGATMRHDYYRAAKVAATNVEAAIRAAAGEATAEASAPSPARR